jgi:hypothetical protein
MTKTDDKLVTMLLQNKDVVDVNAVLASPRYQAVYGHAFAEAVCENGNPHLDPKKVLRALERCREVANAELVYALILHPKNTPEEAFLGACAWNQCKVAEGFAPVMDKFVVQRAFQDAVERGSVELAEMLLTYIDPEALLVEMMAAASRTYIELD